MKNAHLAIFHRGFVDCCGAGRAHQCEGENRGSAETRGAAVYLLISFRERAALQSEAHSLAWGARFHL